MTWRVVCVFFNSCMLNAITCFVQLFTRFSLNLYHTIFQMGRNRQERTRNFPGFRLCREVHVFSECGLCSEYSTM